jgi:hypothetical protein
MKLIFHQAMTDLRAQRWLVAAWAAMLMAACSVEALKLEASLVYPLLALSLGRVVLGWVLAIRIVHADPLDSTSAFWLTRPLSPRMLLAAKAGLISALLLVVPAAGAFIVFVANGIAIAALPGILAQWLLIEALPLLPIVLIATLTHDVARMVITLLVGLVSRWVLRLSSWTWWSALPVEVRASVSLWQAGVVFAWLVVAAGVLALCSTLIARHYLARRTAGVAFAALVGAVGIAAITALWPIQLMIGYRPSWDGAEAAGTGWRGADAVRVTVPGEGLRVLRDPNRDRLVGDLRIEGLGDDVIVHAAGGQGTVRISEGAEVLEQRRSYAIGFGAGPVSVADHASRGHFERVTGVRLVVPFPAESIGLRLVEAKPGVFASRQGRPATYDANLVFDAYRIRTAAVIPLKVGAVGRVGNVVATVLAIRKEPKYSGWVIDVRQAMPILLSGDDVQIGSFVRNRSRGEAMAVLPGGSANVALRWLSATCVVTARLTYVPTRGLPRGMSLDAAWLADAELVFVSFERLGRFTKHVTIPSFVLPPVRSPQP